LPLITFSADFYAAIFDIIIDADIAAYFDAIFSPPYYFDITMPLPLLFDTLPLIILMPLLFFA